MSDKDHLWEAHRDRASAFLEQARFLHETKMFDGASQLAVASCIQSAKAVVVRLGQERDPEDLFDAMRKMVKDGRLPPNITRITSSIYGLRTEGTEGARGIDEKRSEETLELAEGYGRALENAANLTESRLSPIVKQAAARKGISVPMGWGDLTADGPRP